MKLWGGRFTKATDKSVEEFNASIQFDCRMYAEDICGSIAHATMLAKQGIISQEDKDAIVKGLKAIFQQIEDGNFDFSVELEDIHMNIEKRLTDAIGEAGKRLHTGRSRNDQVALDTHMYVRREIAAVAKLLVKLQESLVKAAESTATSSCRAIPTSSGLSRSSSATTSWPISPCCPVTSST